MEPLVMQAGLSDNISSNSIQVRHAAGHQEAAGPHHNCQPSSQAVGSTAVESMPRQPSQPECSSGLLPPTSKGVNGRIRNGMHGAHSGNQPWYPTANGHHKRASSLGSSPAFPDSLQPVGAAGAKDSSIDMAGLPHASGHSGPVGLPAYPLTQLLLQPQLDSDVGHQARLRHSYSAASLNTQPTALQGPASHSPGMQQGEAGAGSASLAKGAGAHQQRGLGGFAPGRDTGFAHSHKGGRSSYSSLVPAAVGKWPTGGRNGTYVKGQGKGSMDDLLLPISQQQPQHQPQPPQPPQHPQQQLSYQQPAAQPRSSSRPAPSHTRGTGQEGGVQTCTAPGPQQQLSHQPSASSDLERLMVQVTPMISLDCSGQPVAQALRSLTLDAVWRFYAEPSVYGREVYTLGGARGPSLCYFVPYLSAIQLFTAASPRDPGTSRLYVSDTEGWPKHMHLRFEHFETELPFNRYPLYEHISLLARQQAAAAAPRTTTSTTTAPAPATSPESESLTQAPGQHRQLAGSTQGGGDSSASSSRPPSRGPSLDAGSGGPASSSTPGLGPGPAQLADPQAGSGGGVLHAMHIADLHPASWYAVAWYPVYRIPDAPLNARFLTFHSFAPLVASIQNTLAALQDGQQRPMQVLPVGIVGLKWYNMFGERWLEPLTVDGPGGQVTSVLRGQEEAQQAAGSAGYGAWTPTGQPRWQQVQAQQMDLQFQAHLSELQTTAERLARGHGLRLLGQMGAEEVRLRHPDFEFFDSRSIART
ncbi:hypothetical protein V8C86DRAFT_2733645 [Haematococcus lacustris]